jgi:uncharacterized protein YbjT (DUF2867 family)
MDVALFGATGFVGGYLVDALLDAGHRPSVLLRPGSAAKLRRAGQCRVTGGDLDTAPALRDTLTGCAAVIYNVGLLREFPRHGISFEKAHYQGVVDVAAAAQAAGVSRFLLMSANGVKQPGTPYQETKRRAELFIASRAFEYTVFRPSVIFGDPRGTMEIATQLYRDLVRPPLPAPGFHTGLIPAAGRVLMSPVYAGDVAAAFVAALDEPRTIGRSIEIGGPETLSWTDMLRRVATATGRRKLILPMPLGVMKLAAALFDWLPFFPVTGGQLTMLAEGNVAGPDELRALIGREPRPFNVENLAYLAS